MTRSVSATRWLAVIGSVVALVASAAACSSDDETSTTTTTIASRRMPADQLAELTGALDAAPGCDVIDTTSCLLPFPSDVFTTTDRKTSTGRLVNLPAGVLANAKGEPLDTAEWNRNDGFSPGTPMIIDLPGVDLAKTGAANIGDIARSVRAASATVVLDMTTGKRLAHWAEIDSGAPPESALTLIHPAVSLPEGHRIAVAVKRAVRADGSPVAPTVGFRAYRDNLRTADPRVEDRRSDMDEVFQALSTAGVKRGDLSVAWDFTVASAQNIAGRLLSIRDQSFESLGDKAPEFHVTETINDPTRLHEGVGRLVRGTFQVPSFLTGDGSPGSTMSYGADGVPTPSGSVITQPFSCQVPAAALTGSGATTRPVVYGHGLLGSHSEVENSQVAKIVSTNDMLYCATDWIGFAEGDLGQAVKALGNLSDFPAVADRSQQGILGQLWLARLMKHPEGLGSDPAFQNSSGQPIINPTEVFFDGNSQGSIMGGAATAVSTEWTRAVLGVPGMNYSILLSRSTDFSEYFVVLRAAYPDRTEQQIIYGILQMLWDRFETNGFAAHLTTNPYPKTPAHSVQLHVAFGDHQVAQVTAEIEARTIGARIRQPALADGRHPDKVPFFGLKAPDGYPFAGSILIYFDSGTLPPPPANIPPTESAEWKQTCGSLTEEEVDHDARCNDPHEDPRRQVASIKAKDAFFKPGGKVIDPCAGKPCVSTPRFDLDY